MYKIFLIVTMLLPNLIIGRQAADSVKNLNLKTASDKDDASLNNLREKLESSMLNGNEHLFIKTALQISSDYMDRYSHKECIFFLESLIRNYTDEISDLNASLLYDELGGVYKENGEYVKAQRFYFKSLNIREQLGVDSLLTASYRKIGELYGLQGNDSLSIDYFNKQLSQAQKLNQKKEIHSALINLSVPTIGSGKSEQSLSYLNKALRLNISNNYEKWSLADIYNNMGWAHDGLGSFDSSIHYYQKSLLIKENINAKNKATTHNNLGFTYYQLLFLDSALNNFLIAEEMALHQNQRKLLHLIFANITNTYDQIEMCEEAFSYFHKYDTLGTLLFNEEKARQLSELQTKYETEKKDQEIKIQKAELDLTNAEKERLMYILLISLGFTVIIIYIYTQRQKAVRNLRRKEEELHTQEVGKLIQEQELKSINSMLEGEEKERKRIAEDLHDRVGSMLSAMKLQSDPANEKMVNLLDETADEVRRISHNLETQVLNRFGLVAALEDLADKIKSSGKIEFELHHLDLDERLDNKIEINTYRIVQELISNALKHSQATTITTQVNCLDDQLIIMVEDNGIGFDSLSAKKQGGMGLSNVASRAHELNGNLNIDSGKGQGTVITVDIPL